MDVCRGEVSASGGGCGQRGRGVGNETRPIPGVLCEIVGMSSTDVWGPNRSSIASAAPTRGERERPLIQCLRDADLGKRRGP